MQSGMPSQNDAVVIAVSVPSVAGNTFDDVEFAAVAMYGAEVLSIASKAAEFEVCVINPFIVASVALEAK